MDSAKRLGKRIVGYPNDVIPIVSVHDWAGRHTSNFRQRVSDFFVSLFPLITWLPRYNFGWLTGDVIAGLTVGMVLVPQGMSYAQLATLPPEYGLYSSFVGVLIYCFFATSKDVSIGPVAVMSLVTSQLVKHVQEAHPGKWAGPTIASAFALVCGFIVLGIGLLRLGWIVEFIPAPAVSGFMTGSAITIAAGQVPGLMGITGFDTRAATYKVVINTLKGLPRTQLDAAWGLTGLVTLYTIRFTCERLTRRFPRRARLFFFLSVLRHAFVLIVLTIAAWLYCRHRKTSKGKYPIKILQNVPSGFRHVGRPFINNELVRALAPELPVATIILFLEHIAISKSFGRINGYRINPNQELIAIGVTNTIGSCFGAYPATGSFSRTALKSKSGVRTPAAGIVTALVVLVALYGLTPAFFWIPTAGLSAVIIHAVADLVASPAQVYSYWRVSPLEFFIWVATVLVTVFSSVENGIYMSISASLALLLIRLAHPRGYFLGKVIVHTEGAEGKEKRVIFAPLKGNGINNTHLHIVPPSPGVIVYRFEESYLYPNSSIVNSVMVDYVKEKMRRGKDMSNVRARDRPWNDPGPGRERAEAEYLDNQKKPDLHAIVFDFAQVAQIDTTAVQALIDTRTEVEKWVDHPVEFHFASILSPWIHRALVAGGFGVGVPSFRVPRDLAAVVPYREGRSSVTEEQDNSKFYNDDVEAYAKVAKSQSGSNGDGFEPLLSTYTPFFHVDLLSAVEAAETSVSIPK